MTDKETKSTKDRLEADQQLAKEAAEQQTKESVDSATNNENEQVKAEEAVETEQTYQERVFEGEAEVVDSEAASSEEKSWSMFAHLASFVAIVPLIPVIGMVLGPLVVWLLKKEDMPLVAENGKEALNFNISMFIAYCVSFFLMFILIGIPLFFGLVIFHFVVTIMAAIKASEGGVYKYPFSLKLIQ